MSRSKTVTNRAFCGRAIAVLCISLGILGCSSVSQKTEARWVGHTEAGKASFYDMKYQSRKTASGEIFNQSAKTAAHRTLPFGSNVKVTNVANGKSVVVKINDRGPFVKGRVIDLSQSAFNSIGDLRAGLIDVKILVVE
jgi:rare lipoprotein A